MSAQQFRQGPLTGLRVLDVSIMAAGPWAGALLGMLGAEVIKIESPAGDSMRHVMPTQRGMGTNFICMNVNKSDFILDLKSVDGREQALALAATCDVFLQNFRVGVIDRLGLGYTALHAINPRMVYCSISGFGEKGPLAEAGCIDTIMQAFSGFASANGAPGQDLEAFRFTGFIDLATAAVAVEAVLAALAARDVTGEGQKVEVSMLEAALEMQFTRISELLGAGVIPAAMGSESPALVPDRAFATLDEEVFVTVHNEREWMGFCRALERPDLENDLRFSTNRARHAHRQALHAIVEPVLRERPAIWWLRSLQRQGVPSGLAHHFETFRHHQQVVENEMIARVATRAWGEISVGGAPWHFSEHACVVTEPSVPELRTESASPAFSVAQAPVVPAHTRATTELRIVELSEGVAGPLAALRLSDLGADVIKIEPPEGDWMRGAEPPLNGSEGGAAFSELNRGKRSLALVQDAATNRALVQPLLETADVFITDRTDEALLELGLDPAPPQNRELIVVSISPWGARGPLRHRKGSELTAQAMAGYTRYLGARGQPAVRVGADVASTATGIFACQAALAALLVRNRTGKGQRVSLSLLNSLLSMKTIHLAAQSEPDVFAGPRVGGATHPPDRGWRTADRRIYLTFGGRPGWQDFMREIGLGHLLSDPRFDKTGRNSTGHGNNAHLLHSEYESAFLRYPAEELLALIRKHMGNAGIFQSASEAIEHEQTRAMGIVQNVGTHDKSTLRLRAFPAQFSGLTPRLRGEVPALDAHRSAIREEIATRSIARQQRNPEPQGTRTAGADE